MKRLLALAVLVAAFTMPSVSHAAKPAHDDWYSCRLALGQHGQIASRACWTHVMPRRHAMPQGWWIRRDRITQRIEKSVRYPEFVKPAPPPAAPTPVQPSGGYQETVSTTAYAPGCGASGYMASGEWPFVGAAAGMWPFGTRIAVPGFGVVTVLDRGVGYGALDLYVNSCAQADAWGRQELTVTVY